MQKKDTKINEFLVLDELRIELETSVQKKVNALGIALGAEKYRVGRLLVTDFSTPAEVRLVSNIELLLDVVYKDIREIQDFLISTHSINSESCSGHEEKD